MLELILTTALGLGTAGGSVKDFHLASKDGVIVEGQADVPGARPLGAVILSAGTGGHDRDMLYGRTRSARDLVFRDLAQRFEQRGLAVVRYDKRGVVYGKPPSGASESITKMPSASGHDKAISATVTTQTQLDDLRTVYDWTRSKRGLGAACVVIFAHSEGMANTGRMAASGAPAPRLVIGMGGLAESPVGALRWQMAERNAFALEQMDSNHDGVTTNAEIDANWRQTPSGGLPDPTSLYNPAGQWTPADLAKMKAQETAAYEQQKRDALGTADSAPWPDAQTSAASFQWWKSWFIDDTPVAERLSSWKTRFIFHYGSIDSQTNSARQTAAIRQYLPANEVTVEIHPGVGHSLGPDPALGPIDERIADEIADEAAAACKKS